MALARTPKTPLTPAVVESIGGATNSAADSNLQTAPRQISPFAGWRSAVLLGCVLIFAVWLRFPGISDGLPYLYDEDEAHHFNRIVKMLQTGDYNPHYFYKPALHFYLRLPVTAIAFFKGVEQGQLKRIDGVATTNHFGHSAHEFTASHPSLVKYNRAFTLLLSLLGVWLLFLLTNEIAGPVAAVISTLLLTLSPLHLALSTHIGVDIQLSLLVLWVTLVSFKTVSSKPPRLEPSSPRPAVGALLFAAFLTGLAMATKYNAFPLLAVPLSACVILAFMQRPFLPTTASNHRSALDMGSSAELMERVFWLVGGCTLLLAAAACGYLLGAPYTLLDPKAFLNGAAFEVLHYKTGNNIDPGLAQLWYYTKLVGSQALGWCSLGLAPIGVVLSLKKRWLTPAQLLVLLAFPIAFTAYMCTQRVNYPRNILPVLPFVALFAAVTCAYVVQLLLRSPGRLSFAPRVVASCAILALIFLAPGVTTLNQRLHYTPTTDTRDALRAWYTQSIPAEFTVAAAGELLLPFEMRMSKNVSQFSYSRLAQGRGSFLELWNRGVDYVVVPTRAEPTWQEQQLKPVLELSGATFPQRVVKSPGIRVFQLNEVAQDGFVTSSRRAVKQNQDNIKVEPVNWSSFSRAAELSADSPLLADGTVGFETGWSEVEHRPAERIRISHAIFPKTFRTLQGRYGTITLVPPSAPGRYQLELVLAPMTPPNPVPLRLSLSMDENLIGSIDIQPGWGVYRVEIPAAALHRNADRPGNATSRLEFVASRTDLPLRPGPTVSSVALHRIRLERFTVRGSTNY